MNLSVSHLQDAVSQFFWTLGQQIMKFVCLPRNAPILKGSVPRGERNCSHPPLLCTSALYSASPLVSLTVSLETQKYTVVPGAWMGDFCSWKVLLLTWWAWKPLWSFSSLFLMLQRESTLKPIWGIGHTQRGRRTHISYVQFTVRCIP